MDLGRAVGRMISSFIAWFEDPHNVERFVRRFVTYAVLVVLAIFLVTNCIFIVDETQQVVITELGKPVRVIHEPGIAFKLPLIQTLNVYEKRTMIYDADPTKVVTKDKKNLEIDNYAVWQIADPLKFLQTVQTETSFIGKLNDIIYAQLRQELGQHDLSDIVVTKRDDLMAAVTRQVNKAGEEYGIRILDVRIKRADLPKETKEHIYARMTAERDKMAKKYRSEGQQIATEIEAETDMQREIILAEAYKEAEVIKGEGDAQAARIYANAYGKDEGFYEFIRSLDAYRKALGDNTLLILSSENDFLKYLTSKGELAP